MEKYQTKHIAALYNISRETVRAWSTEFDEYLSPSARPERGKKRVFTDDDLEVFALIAQSKNSGMTFEQIHPLLKAGERGSAPDPELAVVASSESSKVVTLTRRIMVLEKELREAQSSRAMQEGQITELRQQIKDMRARMDELVTRAARAEALLEVERDKRDSD